MNNYRYGFNGHEKLDEVKGVTGSVVDMGDRWLDTRLGRTAKPDKQAKKYPDISPYAFAGNNPIYLIDPDGEEVTIHGADAEATRAALQKVTSIKLSIDANGKLAGELPQTPSTFSKLDIALLNAIKDENVSVNLTTTQKEVETSRSNSNLQIGIEVGAFDGNKKLPSGKVVTSQFLNISQAQNEEDQGGNTVGTNAAHEILESFIIGKDSPNTTTKGVANREPTATESFLKGHDKAGEIDPNFSEAELSDKPGMIKVNGKDIDVNKKKED